MKELNGSSTLISTRWRGLCHYIFKIDIIYFQRQSIRIFVPIL